MARGYFIETSVIIEYLRGKADTVAVLDELEGPFVSGFICLAELYDGIFRVHDKEQAEAAVLHFFRGLDEIRALDEESARIFGATRAVLKKRGSVIEDIDLIIAALCISGGYTLLTRNTKHFERVPDLSLYSWRA